MTKIVPTNFFWLLLASTISFGWNVPGTHAYATVGVVCQEFSTSDDDGSSAKETLCAFAEMYGPSPAQYPNGTVVCLGGYEWNYDILDLTGSSPDEVMASSTPPMELPTSGVTISVKQDDDGSCTVQLNGQDCEACIVCNEEPHSITVDCSAIDGGRHVATCEPLRDIFYPVEGYFQAEEETVVMPLTNNVEGEAADPAFLQSLHLLAAIISFLALPLAALVSL